ncbi:MAG: TolC family protein [Verrucomicrobiota bacterium]|nr:TolC family protein [Verrucomicrobiota bacterium]
MKRRIAFATSIGVLLLGSAGAITLDAALARTLEKNPAIQQAKSGVEQASGRRLVLRARSLPDVAVIVPGGVQGGHRAGENRVQPFAFAQGFFTQPLFNFGIPAARRRGSVEVLIAQQRLNMAVLEQLHAVRIAYYTAAFNGSMRTLAETQRQRLEGNAVAQADRYQAGQSDRSALNVARALERQLQPRVEEARRLHDGALLKIAELMGDDLGPGAHLPSVEGELRWTNMPARDATAESRAAVEQRPDLKLARLLVRAATEDQRIIEAGYYPAINATISGQYIPVSDIRRGSEGSARRSDDIVSSEARFGAIYTWRVIDNGKVSGAVQQQRAVREINELTLGRLEANVPLELTRIENNLQALNARQASTVRAVGGAERTVEDVQNSLAEGRSSPLEYRTAESSYLEARTALLSIAFEQNVALAERDRATGRYFQFSDGND